MKASEIVANCPALGAAIVHRDADFAALGYITHRINTKPFMAFAGSPRFIDAALKNPLVRVIITTADLAELVPSPVGVILATDPVRAFYDAHLYLVKETQFYWESFENDIHPTAQIAPSAIIADKNVRIGARTVIEEGVIIKERTIIGSDCVIRPRCVLSTEGFEFKKFGDQLEFVPHGHGVVLGNSVYLHAGITVDRGLFGDPTSVGDFSCIDNLIHVAHGVRIGKNCIIAAGAIFAAAVIMEDGSRIDPNATIAHELKIGAGGYVTMGSVVTRDVEPGQKVTGNFALDHTKFMANLRALARGLQRD